MIVFLLCILCFKKYHNQIKYQYWCIINIGQKKCTKVYRTFSLIDTYVSIKVPQLSVAVSDRLFLLISV